MTPLRFPTKLTRPEGVGTWTFAEVPRAISEKAGLRTHQRVRGTIDGAPFASSLMPQGGGLLFLVVKSEVRQVIGKSAGEAVEVIMELDLSPRSIPVPQRLQQELKSDPIARKAFETLAPSHRKAFSQWVAETRRDETRERRVMETVRMLRDGEKLT